MSRGAYNGECTIKELKKIKKGEGRGGIGVARSNEGLLNAKAIVSIKSVTFNRLNIDAVLSNADLTYPLFVKPVRAGSSFGITKAASQQELKAAIELAFQHDMEVIVEEAIDGFEVGCAVLGTDTLIVGRVDEIELSDGFFDYTEKGGKKRMDVSYHRHDINDKVWELLEPLCFLLPENLPIYMVVMASMSKVFSLSVTGNVGAI